MKLICLLFAALLAPAITHAQNSNKTAYIVKVNGDTVKGSISARLKDISPKNITFAAEAGGQATVFNPQDISSFAIAGVAKYVSYTGKVSMDKNHFPDLPTLLDTTTRYGSFFLKVFYEGSKVSLLEQEDEQKTRLYIQERGSQPTELIYYQYYSNLGDTRQVRSADMYKETLRLLAQKYNSSNSGIINEINSASFSVPVVGNIVKHINKDERKTAKTFNISFSAGVAYNTVKSTFSGQTIFDGQSSKSHYPRITLGVQAFDTLFLKRFRFRIDLAYTRAKASFYKSEFLGATSIKNEYIAELDQTQLAVVPQVIYNFVNKNNFKLFAGVGLALNYITSSKGLLTRNGVNFDDTYRLQKSWTNFPIQAGVTIHKKLDIYADYNSKNIISLYNLFIVQASSYSVGVRYHFGGAY